MQTKILSPFEILEAASLLKNGEVVAFPTETVYGLGALIFNPSAIHRIFQVKGRPTDNPLIAHISDFSQVSQIAIALPEDFHLLAKAFWPGPLTIVVRKHPLVPLIATAGLDSIGIRMPSHKMARQLISEIGHPLVAPSANLSGRPSPTDVQHVIEDLSDRIPAVLDGGRCEIGIESTVVSLLDETPQILRPGCITKEDLEKVLLKPVLEESSHSDRPASPGMKYRHYAPKAIVSLFYSAQEIKSKLSQKRHNVLVLGSPDCPFSQMDNFLPCSQYDLYYALRYADEKKFSEVYVYCDKELELDYALMNRIVKATSS